MPDPYSIRHIIDDDATVLDLNIDHPYRPRRVQVFIYNDGSAPRIWVDNWEILD